MRPAHLPMATRLSCHLEMMLCPLALTPTRRGTASVTNLGLGQLLVYVHGGWCVVVGARRACCAKLANLP